MSCHISEKIKIIYTPLVIALLITFTSSDVLCENESTDPIIAEESIGPISRFLFNLDTDVTSLVSRIPNPITQFSQNLLQPVIGLYGNVVESVIETTNNGNNNKRSSAVGKLDKVQFLLYSDRSANNNESFTNLIPEDNSSIKSAVFTKARPIKILIHGFQAAAYYPFPQRTKNAYLKNTNFSVIAVDWAPLSYPPFSVIRWLFTYPSALNNVMFVARRVAALVESLQRNNITRSPDDIHLIGFNLGCHIAGQAGILIERRLGSKVGRITAIEPTSPLVQTENNEMRIDRSHAKFVDVIHSSYLSIYNPLGHADFYPNGGRNQPQCFDGVNGFENPIQALLDLRSQCSQSIGYELFSASISDSKSFMGCRCHSWADYRNSCKNDCAARAPLGEMCPPTARGEYYLEADDLPLEVIRPAGPVDIFG